jgi:hypothetical protein
VRGAESNEHPAAQIARERSGGSGLCTLLLVTERERCRAVAFPPADEHHHAHSERKPRFGRRLIAPVFTTGPARARD